MTSISELERSNLEAHVELCAERYEGLNLSIKTLVERMQEASDQREEMLKLLKIQDQKRENEVRTWQTAIIGGLLAIVVYFITHYVIK